MDRHRTAVIIDRLKASRPAVTLTRVAVREGTAAADRGLDDGQPISFADLSQKLLHCIRRV